MLEIEIVPCLSDNYAYLIRDPASGCAGVVDPSQAAPVEAALSAKGWRLTHILNTHHHFDHTGGNLELKAAHGARIVGPQADAERIPGIDETVAEGQPWRFGSRPVRIFDIPAHTRGHIAFWFEDDGAVFTGDTLFAMGCGRLFEGTAVQMFDAMRKLEALPPETRVYCGHEYTVSNARFAVTVEADNAELAAAYAEAQADRAAGRFTIPSTIGRERATNPFMRAATPERLAEIRAAKDAFR